MLLATVGKKGQLSKAGPRHFAIAAVLRVPTHLQQRQSPHLAFGRGFRYPRGQQDVPARLPPLLSRQTSWGTRRLGPRAGTAPTSRSPTVSWALSSRLPPVLSASSFVTSPLLPPLLPLLAFVPSLLFPSLLPAASLHLQSLLRLPSLCQLSIDPLFSISGQLS